MDESLWKLVAENLGVELGEEFKVEGLEMPFKITQEGIRLYMNSEWIQPLPELEVGILHKTTPIIPKPPKPWKPKVMEKYWFVKFLPEFNELQVSSNIWWGNEFDLTNFATKNCFKTASEAKKDGGKIIHKLWEVYNNAT